MIHFFITFLWSLKSFVYIRDSNSNSYPKEQNINFFFNSNLAFQGWSVQGIKGVELSLLRHVLAMNNTVITCIISQILGFHPRAKHLEVGHQTTFTGVSILNTPSHFSWQRMCWNPGNWEFWKVHATHSIKNACLYQSFNKFQGSKATNPSHLKNFLAFILILPKLFD